MSVNKAKIQVHIEQEPDLFYEMEYEMQEHSEQKVCVWMCESVQFMCRSCSMGWCDLYKWTSHICCRSQLFFSGCLHGTTNTWTSFWVCRWLHWPIINLLSRIHLTPPSIGCGNISSNPNFYAIPGWLFWHILPKRAAAFERDQLLIHTHIPAWIEEHWETLDPHFPNCCY